MNELPRSKLTGYPSGRFFIQGTSRPLGTPAQGNPRASSWGVWRLK